jgi:flagellar hook-associated protein 2
MASVASVSGLASGIDSASLVTQLMQAEAGPQNLLKKQLTATQTDAAAYRDINTSFAALVAAASDLTGTGITSARTVASTQSTVTASAGPTAVPGSAVTFSVNQLATAQTSVSSGVWTSASADVRSQSPGWPLTVVDPATGATKGTINVPAGATLAQAADAITKSGLGLTGTVVQLDSTHYKLQVSSTATGNKNAFDLQSATDPTPGSGFTVGSAAQDASLDLGNGLVATSPSNTFTELITGVSVTVSAVTATPGTVTVKNDSDAVTKKVQAMVDAANAALTKIAQYTDSSAGSTAALKGDYPMNSLADRVLRAVSSAVGSDGSAAVAGLQLTRDGSLTFDATKFQATLAADPARLQRLLGGSTDVGADGIRGTIDDTLATDGIAARLVQLGQRATDRVNGTLTQLAKSQDANAKDLQKQIDDWDLRLQTRQQTLTAQFTAMETALSTIKNQSSWLAGQIGQLPTYSK